ncbi:MAG: hypothetical protein C5B48_09245 [Candidatus Rokuibacteriota bacterium]|nr:MAG: hypothetical protein C5B48_09245 [Candidatus Rokubacteria bacterium]
MEPQRLEAFPLLASLTAEERSQLAAWLDERAVSDGEMIAAEGASGYTFYLVEEGTAAVAHEGRRVAELGPGDYFGEGAILGGGRRVASVQSITPMRLLVLHGQEFRRMEAAMPRVAELLRETLTARLEELEAPGGAASSL